MKKLHFFFQALLAAMLIYFFGMRLLDADSKVLENEFAIAIDLHYVLKAAKNFGDYAVWNTCYVYPPLVAWFLKPFSLMDFHLLWKIWMVASIIILGLALYIIRRIQKIDGVTSLFAVISFPPIYTALLVGQNSFLTLLIILSMVALWKRQKERLAILLFALLFYKPQMMACLFLVMVLQKQWLRALRMVVAALGMVLVGIVVCGSDLYAWWFQVVFRGLGSGFSQAFNVTWLGLFNEFFPGPLAQTAAVTVLVLTGLVVFFKVPLRKETLFFPLLLLIVICLPYMGGSDLVILLPCLMMIQTNVSRLLHMAICISCLIGDAFGISNLIMSWVLSAFGWHLFYVLNMREGTSGTQTNLIA